MRALWSDVKVIALCALAGIVLALLVVLMSRTVIAAAECSVKAVPTLSTAPLRYVRATTTVEPDPRHARIVVGLFGPEGEVSTTQVWERGWTDHPRTQQVEWKSLTEPGGTYEVILQVTRTDGSVCRATARLVVAG